MPTTFALYSISHQVHSDSQTGTLAHDEGSLKRLHRANAGTAQCTSVPLDKTTDCRGHAVKKQIIGGDVKLCKCYFYMHADRVCGGRHYGALDEC